MALCNGSLLPGKLVKPVLNIRKLENKAHDGTKKTLELQHHTKGEIPTIASKNKLEKFLHIR
jgi:hypothetical protein